MPYVVTLDKIAPTKEAVENLVRKGTVSNKDVRLIESGNVKAVRIASINRICEMERCQPEDLFTYANQEAQTSRR